MTSWLAILAATDWMWVSAVAALLILPFAIATVLRNTKGDNNGR